MWLSVYDLAGRSPWRGIVGSSYSRGLHIASGHGVEGSTDYNGIDCGLCKRQPNEVSTFESIPDSILLSSSQI